jgi:hypothetical protein
LRLPISEIVARLRQRLGAKLVAYVASLGETHTVGLWAHAGAVPTSEVEARLRATYRLASLLMEKDTAAVVQAWFQGANEHLADRAPARVLRDGDIATSEQALIEAVHAHSS